MRLRNSATDYGSIAKSLHWATVALVLLAWALGTFGDELPRGAARSAGESLHIAAGLAVIALLILRLLWRLVDPPPSPERVPFGDWVVFAGRLTHIALYTLLAAVPLLGILVQFARGEALPVFGLVDIASPWVRDRAFFRALKEIHELLANVLVIVAAFHAAAALVHHWLWRDRTLERMLPRVSR